MGWMNSLQQFLHTIDSQITLETPWKIPSCCHQDHHLMDDISQIGLPTRELKLIQNIQLYLQVTILLSKICNQAGTHILQQYLQMPDLDSPLNQAYLHLGSTLKWLIQTIPSQTAWKLWHKIVTRQYCHTAATKLLQPMGAWIQETYNLYWEWTWYLCILTNTLYQ